MLKAFLRNDKIEAGCDEAGRGCLAGPVFAAAVILPKDFSHPFLRDSKKLNFIQKEELFHFIKANAIDFKVSQVTPGKIDKINILNASILAMHKALDRLKTRPELILVDGNRFKPYKKIPFECIIKGDDKFYSIAAASVLAKVSRDRYMKRMAKKYPYYSWETNMGYPTITHRKSILENGISPLHRKSFRLFGDGQMKLFE
ncbi:MAG: ribonuclease HII [Saprospiraceae bacterium]|nr:ribonuclease HII [Bacteroidia bacterium]NNK89872.1 ribonuclease HII [Saprospiraceae bacterium]